MVPVWIGRGQSVAAKFRMPAKVWLVGIAGPWGYTVCFFISYQMITPVHASLLLLSWPVMLLLANAILRDRRIRWWHGLAACRTEVRENGCGRIAMWRGHGIERLS